MPTITVDRALWYHVSRLDVDFAAIADFYDDLSLTDKPPLQDCKIHISALGYYWRVPRSAGGGMLLRRFWSVPAIHLLVSEDSHLIDALAPPADILLLAGTSVRKGDYSLLVHRLALALMHYALGQDAYPPMADEEARLRKELGQREAEARERLGGAAGIVANGIGVLLGAAFGAVTAGALGQVGSSFAEGLGFGTVEQSADTRAELKAIFEIGSKILVLAHTRDQSARLPASITGTALEESALQFCPREGKYLRPPIRFRSDRKPGKFFIEMRHMQRSLGIMPLRRWGRAG
jgi:hypothetical protein